jgi:NAD(P)H-flavin reductase
MQCLGPLGQPFEAIDPPAEAWLVAGGVGLAPFMTLAEALRARGTTTRLFYGARRASELYYVDGVRATRCRGRAGYRRRQPRRSWIRDAAAR